MKIKLFSVAALALLFPAGIRAQVVLAEPDESSFRMHLGPLGLTPTVALTNAGVDTNVPGTLAVALSCVAPSAAP